MQSPLNRALISGADNLEGISIGALDEFSRADCLSLGVVLMFVTTVAEPEQPLKGAFNQFVGSPEDLGLVCVPYIPSVARVRSGGRKKKCFFMS